MPFPTFPPAVFIILIYLMKQKNNSKCDENRSAKKKSRRNQEDYSINEKKLNNLKQRNNLTDEEAKMRIKSQIPLDKKTQLADFVIENTGTIKELESKLEQLLNKIKIKVWAMLPLLFF